jgi:hypothetical protein
VSNSQTITVPNPNGILLSTTDQNGASSGLN